MKTLNLILIAAFVAIAASEFVINDRAHLRIVHADTLFLTALLSGAMVVLFFVSVKNKARVEGKIGMVVVGAYLVGRVILSLFV